MTHDEWLTSTRPEQLYSMIRGQATTRKARLLMVACCRLKADVFVDSRFNFVLETAERCADDATAEAVLNDVWNDYITLSKPRTHQTGLESELGLEISVASQLTSEFPGDFTDEERFSTPQAAISYALVLSIRGQPQDVFTGGSGDAVHGCIQRVSSADTIDGNQPSHEGGEGGVQVAMANIVRDIFGNPFQQTLFDDTWRSETIVSIASRMYETRDFSLINILGDALQDVGCADGAILEHCCGLSPHTRGCWLLDLILRKS